MKYSFFKGCKIPYYKPQYGETTEMVCKALDIELVDMEFNCCGYPVRSLNFESYIYTAARNLALSEARSLDICTPCKCCYGSLKHAEHIMRENRNVREKINARLREEGLLWEGKIAIKHLLSVLLEDAGEEKIKSKITRPFQNLKVAAHYGCHALRPSSIVEFDNPLAPTIFERVIETTGAETVQWSKRLECCGNPLRDKNNTISTRLMDAKIESALEAGAQWICSACTYCQMQFDEIQKEEGEKGNIGGEIPSILVTQLLGYAMGMDDGKLSLDENSISLKIESFT